MVRLLFCLWISWQSAGQVLTPRIESSSWRVQPSRYECAMSQTIPRFGEAKFYQRAGETQIFYLDSYANPWQAGSGYLALTPPPWLAGKTKQRIASVLINKGKRPVQLSAKRAQRMLEGLQQGYSPEIGSDSWFAENSETQLVLSAVNFQASYPDYLRCVNDLLPANYEQVKRSALSYKAGGRGLQNSHKKTLRHIAAYLSVDKSITRLYVDGHTDSSGPRSKNREISRLRAVEVTAYLVSQGVDKAKITTRFHGEHYPVASNNNAKGRAINRRTTVRLVRKGDEIEDPTPQKTPENILPALASEVPSNAPAK